MKLPVADILLDSFRIPWHNRGEFLRALLVPLSAYVILDLVYAYWAELTGNKLAMAAWLFLFAKAIVFAWLAVCCHRLVLLGPKQDDPNRKWSKRETQFLVALIGLYLTVSVISVAGVMIFASTASASSQDSSNQTSLISLLAGLPAWFLFSRLSLILPAIALDHPVSWSRAWRQSAGNSWRLFTVVCLLPWVLSSALWAIYTADSDIPVLTAIFTVFTTLLLVCEICALSLCYRFLGHK